MKGVVLSSLQDGFMLWQLPGYDTVLETRRKTELLANARAFCPGLPISFSDSWNVILKGNKKGPGVTFHLDPAAPIAGLLKGRDVRVPAGGSLRAHSVLCSFCSHPFFFTESKSAVCHVDAPLEMPKVFCKS